MKPDLIRGLGVIILGTIIWFLPVPQGLTPQGLRLFAIFVATIVGFILRPLPIGAIAFIGVTFAASAFPVRRPILLGGRPGKSASRLRRRRRRRRGVCHVGNLSHDFQLGH